MASWLDKVKDSLPESSNVGNSGYTWIDGDTVTNSNTGESVRLRGYDAGETGKGVFATLGREDTHPKDASGQTEFRNLANIANRRGFTEVVTDGEKDQYGRSLGDLRNPETGELWSSFVIENGLQSINRFSSDEDVRRSVRGNRDRLSNPMGVDSDIRSARDEIRNDNFMGRPAARSTAVSTFQYNLTPELYSGIASLDSGTNYDGSAKNQWSTSLDNALIGMSSSFAGLKQMIGATIGDEDMVQQGKIDEGLANFRIQLNPSTTVDISQIDGISDTVDYVGNMVAMSLPFMASSIAASAVGVAAAPVVGTLGAASIALLGPSSIMAGQVYNEQSEKNVGAAVVAGIAQGVLEHVGLGHIGNAARAGNKSLKGFLESTARTLASQDGIAMDVARRRIVSASRREIAGFMNDSARFATEQMTARNISRDLVRRAGEAFGGEAVTEMAQEVVAQIGANTENDTFGIIEEGKFQEAFINRVMNAGIGGGLAGSVFGAGGAAINTAGWYDVKNKLSDGTKNLTPQDLYNMDDAMRNLTISEKLDNLDLTGVQPDMVDFFNEEHKTRMRNMTTKERITNSPSTIFSSLFSGAGKGIYGYTTELGMKYPSIGLIGDMFFDTLAKVNPGRGFEQEIAFQMAALDNAVNINEISQGYNGNSRSSKAMREFNNDFYKVANDYVKLGEENYNNKTNKKFDWSKYTAYQQAKFKPLFKELNKLSEDVRNKQNESWNGKGLKYEEKIKHRNNYLLRFKALDKSKVKKDKEKFIRALIDSYGYTRGIAEDLTDKILNKDIIDTSDDKELFNMVTKGLHPSASKNNTIAMSEVDGMQEFHFQDVERNLQEFKKSAVRFITYNKFMGRGGRKLTKLLQDAGDEGASPEVLAQISSSVTDIIQAQSGNYNRPVEGTKGAKLIAISQNLSFISLIVALPLSALSSIVELALTMKGLNNKQVFGPNGLKNMGKEIGMSLYRGVMMFSKDPFVGRETINESKAAKMISYLGLDSVESGAATVTGAAEVSEMKKVWVNRFFKYNGTSGITDLTRLIRIGPGMDFISDHFLTLLKYRGQGSDSIMNNEQRESRAQLRNLGLAVDRYLELYNNDGTLKELTKEQEAFLIDQHDIALYNWVNDAVVLPGAANRPLWYQDPRFALITQFNGFIATFTAHHIPKMWGEYVKRGTPAMKYNAFATMATMIVLGYASQYLKDLIKFGEETPYLDEKGKYRRAINSSGLLGTAERALNIAVPLYPQRSSGPISWAADTVIGEIPAASPVTRLLKSANEAWNGKYEDAKYDLLRAMPVMGPLTGMARVLSGKE